MQPRSPEGRGAAPAANPARPGEKAAEIASRIEQLNAALQGYEKKRAISPAEMKEIEAFRQQLKAEIIALAHELGADRQTEKQPPREVLKLRKELEHAIKEVEQYKARADDRLSAQRALAEAEKARAQAAEAKAKDALKGRARDKKSAEQQRSLTETYQSTPQLKSVEDRLNALAKEMEALRKEIHDLAGRPERESPAVPRTPPKPPARP